MQLGSPGECRGFFLFSPFETLVMFSGPGTLLPRYSYRTLAMEIHMDPSQVICECAENPPEPRRLGHRAA